MILINDQFPILVEERDLGRSTPDREGSANCMIESSPVPLPSATFEIV
jgi:hypothetical protein